MSYNICWFIFFLTSLFVYLKHNLNSRCWCTSGHTYKLKFTQLVLRQMTPSFLPCCILGLDYHPYFKLAAYLVSGVTGRLCDADSILFHRFPNPGNIFLFDSVVAKMQAPIAGVVSATAGTFVGVAIPMDWLVLLQVVPLRVPRPNPTNGPNIYDKPPESILPENPPSPSPF